MDKDSPFSTEYNINDVTESESSTSQVSSVTEEDIFSKQIDANYQLAKPIRKVISARIIPK